MEIKGVIKVINPTIQVSEKFSKREFVITLTTEMYPQDILVQLTQDKCSLLDLFTVGQEVEVGINLRGREWTSPQGEVKYFNTIEGWRVSKVGNIVVAAKEETTPEASQSAEASDDDLSPF